MIRKITAILLLLLFPISAFATFGAGTQWDVQTTGANTNGGAFDPGVGSPGTDESVGSGTAITITLTGTTTGTGSPAFSSTTHGPGNFVHIASGTGCTVGWYEVLSQSSGTATFDHAMGSSTNVCVGVIGGSLLTIAQANTNSVSGNTIWSTGTYTFTSTLAVAQATIRFAGYGATHGDGTQSTWTTATNSTVLINTGAANNGTQQFSYLIFSNTASTRASGIQQQSGHGTNQAWKFTGGKFSGFTTAIDSSDGTPFDVAFITLDGMEVTGSTVAGINFSNAGPVTINNSYFHGNVLDVTQTNAGSGTPGFTAANTVFSGASGAQSVNLGSIGNVAIFRNCDFYNATGIAIKASSGVQNPIITNTVFWGNGTAIVTAFATAGINSFKNAFGSNTNANTDWTGGPTDITLTAIPWVSAGTGDYGLNTTAGGGALLRNAAYPLAFTNSTGVTTQDVGAAQHATASGGGGATASAYSN